MEKINVWNLFKLAWSDFKKSWLFFVASFIIFVIFGVLDAFFGAEEVSWSYNSSIIITVLIELLSIYFIAGIILETLKIVDGGKPCIKNIFIWPKNWKHLVKYFVGYILYSFLVLSPFFFGLWLFVFNPNILYLIIGGLISLVILFYTGFIYNLLAENRYGIFESIKKSFFMVNKNTLTVVKWYMYALIILIVILLKFVIITTILFILGIKEDMLILQLILILMYIFLFIIFGSWISLAFNHLYRQIDPEVMKKIER